MWNGTAVACKCVKHAKDLPVLQRECEYLMAFRHPNVLPIWGVHSKGQNVYLILEWADGGSLLSLIKARELTPADIHKALRDVALGMAYLHDNGILHRYARLIETSSIVLIPTQSLPWCRDLAARNILRSNGIYKVADFGLARDLDQQNEYLMSKSTFHELPIQWTAPEVLKTRKYTPAADVWSFGVLAWEVYSLSVPYSGGGFESVLERIKAGTQLPRPEQCPDNMWQLLQQCWNPEPLQRPTFATIVSRLDAIAPTTE